MDDVPMTRAQVKALHELAVDVTVSAVNTDARMIYVERTQYRGKPGEGKWMLANGRPRDASKSKAA
jgi:hypothetical protein